MAEESEMTPFEQRFNCLICWSPRLRMIYGYCQHRLCENCLYDSSGMRRNGLEKCPTCQLHSAFPIFKPCIPEDNIAIQRQLGVVECSNPGCEAEMWHWELESHLSECSFSEINTEHKCKKMKKSPSKKARQCSYNLRESSRKCSPGKYCTPGVKTRSAKRKIQSM